MNILDMKLAQKGASELETGELNASPYTVYEIEINKAYKGKAVDTIKIKVMGGR